MRDNPAIVRSDLERRGDVGKMKLFEELIQLDADARQLQVQVEGLRHRRNVVSEEIAYLARAGKKADEKRREAEALPVRIKDLQASLDERQGRIRKILMGLPNILHESVPIGKDDTENREVRRWGEPKRGSLRGSQEQRDCGGPARREFRWSAGDIPEREEVV